MIVRCGRCQVELEVAGPGEFACPACGTRNVVRGAEPSPLDLADLTGGPRAAPPAPDPSSVRWVRCPSCAYRFALGDVEEVNCPSCSTKFPVRDQEVSDASD